MKVLITGASSGIGKDLALEFSNYGYDLVLVARNEKALKKVANLCKTKVEVCVMDLSNPENCNRLYKKYKNIDILINNAGFGLFGEFNKTNLDKEMNMIDLNIKGLHTLFKLYLNDMVKRNSGTILNVASTAAFLPGPLMSTYYSTKSYVYNLTMAIYEELRHAKSKVNVSVLCPGPVDTNFNKVANVKFVARGLTSEFVAKYTVKKLLKGKLVIIPGLLNKLGVIGCKLAPVRLLMKIDYHFQKRKDV